MANTGTVPDRRVKNTGLVSRVLPVVLLFLSGLAAAAQVQAPVNVSPGVITEGDVFQINMTVSQAEPNQVLPFPFELPDGLQIVESFVERINSAEGDARFAVRIRALRSGFFELPAFRVSAAGRELSSGAILIQVHPSTGGDVPLEASWQVNSEQPVAGESILISLILQSPDAPVLPDEMRFSPPEWGDFHEVDGVGEFSSTTYATGTLYEVPVVTYIATPTTDGVYTIPAASLRVENTTVRIAARTFEVQPTPARIDSSGAVGSFQYQVTIEPRTIYQGETVDVRVRLEGSGNLPYINLPEPEVENLLLTGTDEFERLQVTDQGFMGVRTVTYRLSARDTGTFTVNVPAFSWYYPQNGRIYTAESVARSVQVLPVPLGSVDQHRARLGLLSNEDIGSLPAVTGHTLLIMLMWLLPAAVGLVIRKTMSRRAGRSVFIAGLTMLSFVSVPAPFAEVGTEAARTYYQNEEYEKAYRNYYAAIEQTPDLPGLWYNAGLSVFRDDRPVAAVHHFRRALSLRPDNAEFREALIWVENGLELSSQIPVPSAVGPAALLASLLLLLNAMTLLWLFFRVRRMGGVAVVFLLMGIVAFSLGIGFGRGFAAQNRSTGVLGDQQSESVFVYRIPVSDVTPWMSLKSGTTVELLDSSGDFFLIRTGLGVHGWVPQDVVTQL